MAYAGYQGYGTPGAIDRQREIARALLRQAVGRTPRNIGEAWKRAGEPSEQTHRNESAYVS